LRFRRFREAGEGAEAAEHPEGKRDQPSGEQRNASCHSRSHQSVPRLAVCGEDRRLRILSPELIHSWS